MLCRSVNDEIIHGIPSRRLLRDGDLLSIDCGACVDGFHGDAAVTVPGGRIGDISAAVRAVCRTAGYGIPAGLGGHGVGARVVVTTDRSRAAHAEHTVAVTVAGPEILTAQP